MVETVLKAAVEIFVNDAVGEMECARVLMNLLDPALIEDGPTGKLFRAQDYAGTEI